MQYYRGDFAEETFSEQHPAVTVLIWWTIMIVLVCILSYFGGIKYLIADLIK